MIKRNLHKDEYKAFFTNLISNDSNVTTSITKDYVESNIYFEESDHYTTKQTSNTNSSSMFNTNFLNILNNIPYFMKLNNLGSTYFNQKTVKNETSNSSLRYHHNSNQINFFQNEKKSDKILHINLCLYNKYSFIIEKL
jgi:hypothetical protein